jgi:hypothetical protein
LAEHNLSRPLHHDKSNESFLFCQHVQWQDNYYFLNYYFYFVNFVQSGENKKHPDFKQYQESALNIKEDFRELQTQLKKLFPLSFRYFCKVIPVKNIHKTIFRLEIMENIFSLLFIRFEHLQTEEATSDSGGEDEESQKSLALLTEASHSQDCQAPNLLDQPELPLPMTNPVQEKEELPVKAAQQSGFMCDPLMIRDTLLFMKECLIDCSSALYKQKSTGSEEIDHELQRRISK